VVDRRIVVVPPNDVLRAFRASEPLARLDGGQGQAFRSGDLVLKPCRDNERTRWVSELHERLEIDGFRVPRPVRSVDGRAVSGGWQAWAFVEGEHRTDRWPEVVDLCVAFHREIADVPRPDWLDRVGLDDPWTIADKVAWDEIEYSFHPSVAPIVERLRRCLRPIDTPSQLIHGDFPGNVLFSEYLPPAVIDFSPYWRPAGFAAGVVVADAIVWEGAEVSLIDEAQGIEGFDQFLARAELRRIIEVDAAHRLWNWDVLGELDAHLPLVEAIEDRCR